MCAAARPTACSGSRRRRCRSAPAPTAAISCPTETERAVDRGVKAISPIRAIAGSGRCRAAVYKQPFAITGPATGWVAETAARPETMPTLAELAFPTMELYAMPAATQTLLDDGAVDIDDWIAEEVEIAFAEQEGTAFVNGDGINKPKGFLTTPCRERLVDLGQYRLRRDRRRRRLRRRPIRPTICIDLIYALKAGYRAERAFVMNRKTQAAIRKFKDADGNYLWQPPRERRRRATLMGFPVAEAEDMPDIAAEQLLDRLRRLRRGYLVVDRAGIRVLRDPYSAKPYVLFYTTKRVGGGVQDFDAIKLLKFGTS